MLARLIILFVILPCLSFAEAKGNVVLYFVNTKNPEYSKNCAAVDQVNFDIFGVNPTILVSLLLNGPSQNEVNKGFIDTFSPSQADMAKAEPLVKYFDKVVVKDGMANVNFKKGAEYYFNNTACIKNAIKIPIEKTLKEFPGIKEVRYSIDNKPITD